MASKEQPGDGRIRILLADDHPQVLEQLAVRLTRENEFDLVGVASNSRTTLQNTLDERPGVLLIDPIMRDGMGLATLRQLVAELPDLAIVVLTAFIDTTLDMQLRSLGISHILTKGISTPQLISELRTAASS